MVLLRTETIVLDRLVHLGSPLTGGMRHLDEMVTPWCMCEILSRLKNSDVFEYNPFRQCVARNSEK